jgi:prephenate dehydrogenase
MNGLVVGSGEMGQWIGELLFCLDGVDEIVFTDRDETAAEAAAAALDGRAVSTDSEERFDIVCVAVPIPAAAETLRSYAPRTERAILDVSGTMADPVGAMAKAGPELERMSLHPLFAPANEPGNVAVVTDADGPITREICAALEARENTLYETTPEEHDEAMETVQARTHAAVLAYALAAEDVPDELQTPISAGLDELAAQVTAGESRVYADIQAAFGGAGDVADAARRIADADQSEFATLYKDTGQ